jgi:Holliday junction resolvase RusA-like endonuclease
MTHITIPGDPQGWQRTRTGNGLHFTAPETRAYQNTIRWLAKAAHMEVITGPVSVVIEAHYRIPDSATKKRKAAMLAGEEYPLKKPDIDNVVKNVLDALNMSAWTDDAQVVSLNVSKVWSDNPRVEVCVEPFKARVSQREAA